MASPDSVHSPVDSVNHPEPTLAMRTVMSSIRFSFPQVRQLSCSTLGEWLKTPSSEPSTSNTTTAEGQRQFGSPNVVLLDIRPDSEFAVSHLVGARRVDPSIVEADLAAFVDELKSDHSKVGRPVKLVCYCSVGYRSSKLATRLQTLLHRQSDEMASPLAGSNQSPAKTDVQVFNLEGSLFQWANENRPLISETGERTRFVHPYSAVWGRLVDTSRHKWNASG